jgi:hypothetical protein
MRRPSRYVTACHKIGEKLMNWEAIAALAQAAGGIAVVISVLYLAFQIRFARLAAADTSRTARSIGVRENVLALVNNAELRKNWMTSSNLESVYEDLGSGLNINAVGAVQVDNMCQSWMWLHWGQYKAIKTNDDSRELENIVAIFYSAPPMLNCWEQSPYGKKVFDKDFVRFVDSAISKHNG